MNFNSHGALPIGPLAVLGAATLWATIGTTYVLIQRRIDIDEVTLVTLRAGGGALIVLLWFGWRDRSAFVVRRADIWRMVTFGLVSVTLFYLVLIYAFRYSSVAIGTILLYLAPAFVTIGAAMWLDDPLTKSKIVALVLSFVGLLLIVEAFRPGELRADLLGIVFGVASAATYGSYSLIAKSLIRRYRPGTLLVWYLGTGAMGLLLVKLVASPVAWPGLADSLAIAGYCGAVITVIPVTLYTIGLRHMPSSDASIVATIEPVIALPLAVALLGEQLGPFQVLGAACVISGVLLLAARGPRNRLSRLTATGSSSDEIR